jgi:protein-tyrosine-phosphatase
MRCHWDEEDVWFYFEVDTEGWVTRQIELEGSALTPVAAASLAEWQWAYDAGRLDEYDSRFGITAELPVSEWEGHDPEQLTSEEFEEVWDSARQRITARPS